MDRMINDIIEIFTKVDGVQLVRLSGLTKREKRISTMINLTPEMVDLVVKKLKLSGVINYHYTMICPFCKEVSYQVIDQDINKPKLCDTCNTMYSLVDGQTLLRDN
jgi:predicted Zn-ribbon and HTH transcriptional regulator